MLKFLEWGLRDYVIVYTIFPPSPVILWISLGGKPKWLPLEFGYYDIMRTSPILKKVYGVPRTCDTRQQCTRQRDLRKGCWSGLACSATWNEKNFTPPPPPPLQKKIEWGLCALRHGNNRYPEFSGSHFGFPPSSIHRMTGLGGKMVLWHLHRPRAHYLHFTGPNYKSERTNSKLRHGPLQSQARIALLNLRIILYGSVCPLHPLKARQNFCFMPHLIDNRRVKTPDQCIKPVHCT